MFELKVIRGLESDALAESIVKQMCISDKQGITLPNAKWTLYALQFCAVLPKKITLEAF